MPTGANGINDAGDVVGSMILNQVYHAHGFLWAQSGTVTDLGFLPGTLETVATAINNSGQVVGYGR
jgi:probable HAF family extracellular repeat protein